MKNRLRRLIPTKIYISIQYFVYFKKWPNIRNPKTFNEKLQWLKVYDHNNKYTIMVDKYDAKRYVAEKIGEKYIIPTYGVWDNPQNIDFDNLPEKYVLKCTNDSGGIFVCDDSRVVDRDDIINKFNNTWNRNGYWYSREWPYKNVKSRVIAEEYIGANLQDYRIYCFNGIPKLIYSYTNESAVDGSKPEPIHCDIFDCDWNPMPFHQKSLPSGKVEKPDTLDEMLEIAKKLSEGIPFVRVDLYEKETLLFGELTLYPGAGLSPFYPREWDRVLGDWIDLTSIENGKKK